MFGFSFTKVIFTAAVVFAVWQAFKYFTRLSEQREERARVNKNRASSARANAASPPPDGVEDMVKCSVCDSYVARGSKSCGKDGCPFRG